MGGFHHGLMINAYDMTEGWGHEVETRREIIRAASRVILNGLKVSGELRNLTIQDRIRYANRSHAHPPPPPLNFILSIH